MSSAKACVAPRVFLRASRAPGASRLVVGGVGFVVAFLALFAPSVARAGWYEDARLPLPAGVPALADALGSCTAARDLGDGSAIAVAGANGHDGNKGRVYVWRRAKADATWSLAQTLDAPERVAGAWFGTSCALRGDRLVVGATGAGTGAAYVFALAQGSFVFDAKLAPDDGEDGDRFGLSVAVDGDTVVVGADTKTVGGKLEAGGAYVFTRTGTSFGAGIPLVAADAQVGDAFGRSVAISGASILVGALQRDVFRGGIYPFTKSGVAWVQGPVLAADDGASGDQLGFSLAMRGDVAIAGASYNATFRDRAFVFAKAGSWSERQRLTVPQSGEFGAAVAMTDDTFFVGDFVGAGKVHVYAGNPAVAVAPSPIVPHDGANGARFGIAVAADGRIAIIGADSADGGRGAVYAFRAGLGAGSACSSGDACVHGHCVDGVCCDTACGGGRTDDCSACSIAAGGTVDGTCGPASAAVVCRASRGACDVLDRCDGASLGCPADVVAPNGQACVEGACLDGACVAGAEPSAPTAGAERAPAASSDEGCAIGESTAIGESGAPRVMFGVLVVAFASLLARRRRVPR